MSVNKDQAQMLATLAAACRPLGARRWDTGGTVAAIGKVKDRSLAEVILATIRAAADRDVDTPGVIPTSGSHWQERLAPQPFTPNLVDRADRCTVCSLHRDQCIQRWTGDHTFAPPHPVEDPPDTWAETRQAVKAARGNPIESRPPRSLDEMTSGPRVQALKAEMAAARVAAAAAIAEEGPA